MKARLEGGPKHAMELPMARVRVVGAHDQMDCDEMDCDEIRSFLRLNRIPYEWVDHDSVPGRAASSNPEDATKPTVFVDEVRLEHPPTDRKVAEALGIGTRPMKKLYDVVIV